MDFWTYYREVGLIVNLEPALQFVYLIHACWEMGKPTLECAAEVTEASTEWKASMNKALSL